MAKRPHIDIVVTARDQSRADEQNRSTFLTRLKKMSTPQLGAFIDNNLHILEGIFPNKKDIASIVETMLETDKELLKQNPAYASQQSKDRKDFFKLTKKLDSQDVIALSKALKIKTADVEDIAKRRTISEQKTKRQEERRWKAIKHDSSEILSSGASILRFAGIAAKTPFLLGTSFLTGLWKGTVVMPANLLSTTFNTLKVPMGVRATFLGLAMTGATAFANGEAPQRFQITMDNMDPVEVKKLPLIAAYDTAFSPDKKAAASDAHAYIVMKSGERMGVPAIALHLISYFETNGFKDVMSGNSTASNNFQVIASTKITNMKQHGKDTLIYLEAKEKIESGTASPSDEILVQAVDEFSKHTINQLVAKFKSRDMEGPLLEAMRLMDNGAFVSQVIALSMKEKFPNLSDPNITPDEVLETVVKYYTKYHFLGEGNYAKLAKAAKNTPETAVRDISGLRDVADKNPAFFKKTTTAGNAFAAIHDAFVKKVGPVFKKFEKEHTTYLSELEAEKARGNPRITVEAPPIRTRWDVTVDTFESLGILTAVASEKAYDYTLGALFADAQEEQSVDKRAEPPVYVDTIVPKAKPESLRGPKPPST